MFRIKYIPIIISILMFSCVEKTENLAINSDNGLGEYDSLKIELTRVVDFYEKCENITYSIDTTLFDYEYEMEMLEANASYRASTESDSSLLNKEYDFRSPPVQWIKKSKNITCKVIYTGILESKDKTIQYAVAYSPRLDLKYRVEIKKNKISNKWELMLSS